MKNLKKGNRPLLDRATNEGIMQAKKGWGMKITAHVIVSVHRILDMDQITIKTPNPKCPLYYSSV